MLPSFQAGISGGGGGSGRYSSAASKVGIILCCSSAIPSGCPVLNYPFYRIRADRANTELCGPQDARQELQMGMNGKESLRSPTVHLAAFLVLSCRCWTCS